METKELKSLPLTEEYSESDSILLIKDTGAKRIPASTFKQNSGGNVDQEQITAAVNEALAEAKASGEFDGESGVYILSEGETIEDAPSDADVVIDPYSDEVVIPEGGTGGADWNAAEGEPGHVLNRTHWVETGIGEIPVTGEWVGNDGYNISAPMGLKAGKNYVVTWDGNDYEVTATAGDEDGVPVVVLGNSTGESNEPFLIMGVDAEYGAELGFYGVAIPVATGGGVDFSIHGEIEIVHKIPEKYVPKLNTYSWDDLGSTFEEGTVLAETSPVYSEDMSGFILTDEIRVIPGKEYTVKWNGVEYTCVCQEVVADAALPALGNLGAIGYGDDTGEPFVILVIPNHLVESMGGLTGQITALDGSESITLSITGTIETVTPLPMKYLPKNGVLYGGNDNFLYKTKDTSNPANKLIKSELIAMVESGMNIWVRKTTDDRQEFYPATAVGFNQIMGQVIINEYFSNTDVKTTIFMVPNNPYDE